MAATFDLTINGVSRISGLQSGTLRITKSFGRRASLQCELFSTDGSWHPTMNQDVVWSTDGTARFGGYIRDITYLGKQTRNNNSVFYAISCADYSSLLEDRLVTEDFPAGQTLKQWLTTLVTNWLSIKGISLDAAQTDGPTMSQPLQVERMRADIVLQQMILRSEYVTRGISATKTLLLFASGSSSAPFNLTSSNRKALGDIQVSPIWNGQKYNRVIIKFGVPGVVEAFYQDVITISGTPTNFSLNYPAVGIYPITASGVFGYGYIDSSVNGRNVVATAPSPFATGSYEYDSANNSISKVGGAAFANGEVLTVPYDFRYPIEVIEETAGAATDPIELLVIDESIRTTAEAELKAQKILAIVQTDTQRVRYYTAEDDLDIAQTQNINVAERFFNDDCIITDLRTSDTAARTSDATAVQFKLVHEVFATQGDQPKRTELDTVMQWSLLGSGSGAVPGTAPNSGGGFGPAPPRYSVQFNNPLGVFDGAEQVLYTDQVFGGTSAKGLVFLDKNAGGTYTSATERFELGVTNNDDVQMAMFGGSYLIDAEYDININAGTISGPTGFQPGALALGATDGIAISPGSITSEFTKLNGMAALEAIAGKFYVVSVFPFSIDTTDPTSAQDFTTFYVTSAGTVSMPPLASFRSFPATNIRRVLAIKNAASTGVVTLDGHLAETIDTSAVLSLPTGSGVLLQGRDASTWAVLATTGGVTLGGGGGGGGATPGGADGDVQYNATGSLSGISAFNYDDVVGQLRLKHVTGHSPIEIVNELGTSAGGPIGFHVGGGFYSEMLFGLDKISTGYIASQANPGYFWHQGNPSGLKAIGAELLVSETVSASATYVNTRGFRIEHDGVLDVYQAGGLGNSATGCGVYVSRNDSNSAAPAWFGLENRSATPSYIWTDATQIARIGLSAPTADNAVSVASGNLIYSGRLIRKTADESVATSVINDDNSLFLSVGANDIWQVEGLLLAANSANTADIRVLFTLPAAATFSYVVTGYDPTGTTQQTNRHVARFQTPLTAGFGVLAAATEAVSPLIIKGLYIGGGTAGVLQLQWAQQTIDAANPTVVKADSYLKATRIE